MREVYAVILTNEYDDVEVSGIFQTLAEAKENIKKSIFTLAETDEDELFFTTADMPVINYTIAKKEIDF